jgi:hypothetical protein
MDNTRCFQCGGHNELFLFEPKPQATNPPVPQVCSKDLLSRKVIVYEYQKTKGQTYFEKVAIGNGIFHAWGVDYAEFETGPGNFSTAIVEMPDGSVKNVPVELIVFNN